MSFDEENLIYCDYCEALVSDNKSGYCPCGEALYPTVDEEFFWKDIDEEDFVDEYPEDFEIDYPFTD